MKSDSGSLSSALSLGCPVRLAFRKRGMGHFRAVGFGCAPRLTEVDPGLGIFLLASQITEQGEGEGSEQQL